MSVSPGRITLTAMVAGALTMSAPGVASATDSVGHAERGAVPEVTDVSQQVAAAQQASTQQTSTQQATTQQSSASAGGLLQNGTSGPEVRDLQRVLNAWYPEQESLAEDGIYGPNTEERVRYLQDRAEIQVDGIAGPETLGTLNMSSSSTSGSAQPPADTGGNGSSESSEPEPESSDEQSQAPSDSDEDSGDVNETSDQTADLSASSGDVVSPTSGRVTSGFGERAGHQGVDIANEIGTPIYSTTDGEVIEAGPANGFGQWVRVQHDDGTISVYGHINEALVSEGEQVSAGEQIATMGNRGQSTGPHLHFEIWENGGQEVNPENWLNERGASL